jgi:hypothetical protein
MGMRIGPRHCGICCPDGSVSVSGVGSVSGPFPASGYGCPSARSSRPNSGHLSHRSASVGRSSPFPTVDLTSRIGFLKKDLTPSGRKTARYGHPDWRERDTMLRTSFRRALAAPARPSGDCSRTRCARVMSGSVDAARTFSSSQFREIDISLARPRNPGARPGIVRVSCSIREIRRNLRHGFGKVPVHRLGRPGAARRRSLLPGLREGSGRVRRATSRLQATIQSKGTVRNSGSPTWDRLIP